MPQPKSYPKIDVSAKTLRMLKYIGSKQTPVTTGELTSELKMTYPTVMTHIATLETENLIQRVGNGYVVGYEVGAMYAILRGLLTREERELNHKKNMLGL